MYWTQRSIPEFATLDAAESKRLWRRRYSVVFRQPGYWLSSLIAVVVFFAACTPVVRYVTGFWESLVLAGAIGGAFAFSLEQITIHFARPYW